MDSFSKKEKCIQVWTEHVDECSNEQKKKEDNLYALVLTCLNTAKKCAFPKKHFLRFKRKHIKHDYMLQDVLQSIT